MKNDKKKKLLIYTDAPFFAGCENVLENIISHNEIKNEFDMVFSYRSSSEYNNGLISRNFKQNVLLVPLFVATNASLLRWINDKYRARVLNMVLKLPLLLLDRAKLYFIINFIRFYFVLKKHKPDIVHANNGGYPGAESVRVMVLAAKAAGCHNIILTVNNMAYPQKSLFEQFVDSNIYEYIKYYVTASCAASRQIQKVRGFGSEKAVVIPNTVLYNWSGKQFDDLLRKEFEIPPDAVVIGSVGLLIDRKGYDVLLEALSSIKVAHNWVLYIFGDGENRNKLEQQVAENGLSQNVFMPGFRDNIHGYISGFDAFVLPSTNNEDLPNVINEAMLLNKPIIGTRIAGIPEQIDNEINGYLVEPSNSNELKEVLQKIIDMEIRARDRLGNSSYKKYMAEFSYELSMNKYHTIYHNL